MNSFVLVQSYLLGLSLILAIGSQNIYIIKLGLQHRRRYTIMAACIAATSDTILITVGTLFMASLTGSMPTIFSYSQWIGCLFLVIYGTSSLTNGLRKRPKGWDNIVKSLSGNVPCTRVPIKTIITTTMFFSLLNPHVYLDTFLILGNVGSKYTGVEKTTFIVGAGLASYSWFLLTGYSASKISNILKCENHVRLFDVSVGIITYYIAYSIAVMDFSAQQPL